MKLPFNHLRSALSMVELVFVIAVLGIVASIGAEIVVQAYQSYLMQRATYRSSIKTELAATQLVNRMAYAIPHTIIGRKSATDTTYVPIDHIDAADYMVLEWIGYDAESFEAFTATDPKPGWSGLCDVNASTVNSISTPGSQLNLASTIIDNLSNTTIADAALFFTDTYNTDNIGYNGVTTGAARIASVAGQTITLDATATGNRTISEMYKLAWTAYAIVPVQRGGGACTDPIAQQCDLELRYDFRPWEGQDYNGNGYRSFVLIRNITAFRFTGSGNTIRFKICQRENIGNDTNITTCKEKAVIR